MQKAVQFLNQHDKKLVEVAQWVGYDSDAPFSQAFSRVIGLTPGSIAKTGVHKELELRPHAASVLTDVL